MKSVWKRYSNTACHQFYGVWLKAYLWHITSFLERELGVGLHISHVKGETLSACSSTKLLATDAATFFESSDSVLVNEYRLHLSPYI